MPQTSTKHALERLQWPAFWLGFALSGFFDGILLHQILQWHHLLSAIRGDDIRFQILMDGYFHFLMYAVAAIGLWLLWRARQSFAAPGSARRFVAYALIGFGVWHVLDAVLTHWLFGIHRIKLDAGNPLFWDIGWLVAFGLVLLAVGWMLRRGGPPAASSPNAATALVALVMIGAGYWSSQPPPGQAFTTIVFSPSVSSAEALSAALSVSDALAWFDGEGVVVVSGVSADDAVALYRRGALLVSGGAAAPGCFAWTSQLV